jgi:hypothetical protein
MAPASLYLLPLFPLLHRRKAEEIACRNPRRPSAKSVDSDVCEVLRHSLWYLIFLLSSGALTDATISTWNTGNRSQRPQPKLSRTTVTPANPPSRFWMQTTPTTTHPSPPCPPASCRDVAIVQGSPETPGLHLQYALAGFLVGTLASPVSLPQIRSDPLDLDRTLPKESLTEGVSFDLVHQIYLRSNDPQS